ncbi:MAG TPA: prolyl oligopeptidase family serine peptidase [Usitatibacter sp.]|nr:prolyl oligopeptidase family serine peptidase [Usitatibacter sp.]
MKTLLLALAFAALEASAQTYPATARKPVTDTYHGVEVRDDYRWLEDNADPAVPAWGSEQLAATRKALDALPLRAQLQSRFKELYNNRPPRYFAFQHRGALFALKRQPPKNQALLVVLKSPDDVASERVLLDPNEMPGGVTTAIDWYAPSLDGKYVAVSISEKGSEQGSAHVFEVASGKRLTDVVPRVNGPTAGGSITWDARATGFYYTRYPQGTERAKEDLDFYQQVYFHKLGTPASADTYVLGKDFPRIAEVELSTTTDGRYVLARVANGDGGEYRYYLRDPGDNWSRIADYSDKVRHMTLGRDGRIYALSLKDAPRGKVIATPLDEPNVGKPRVVVPQSDGTIEAIDVSRERLYVDYMMGGPSEVKVFSLEGGLLANMPTEPITAVGLEVVLEDGDMLFSSTGYVTQTSWYRYSWRSGKITKSKLTPAYTVNLDDAVATREMCVSKDGTRVPVNIVMKKGTKLDGSNPALLTGYGGYGVTLRPFFSSRARAWLDHGGIFAVANLRGGGEFGEEWHHAGNLTRKQNVFDDMIACGEHLVSRGYTSKEKLAAMGGSNGGLLMGALITQRPDLFRAIVSDVGIYDMLRVELTPNGAFNITEFGTVKNAEHFKALYAYSPYHRVKDGTAYPAVLFATGENDGRVDPWHSRKMAARLQAATTSGRPIYLRISMDTGHGQGTATATLIEEDADRFAFLMNELGMK